MDFLFFFDIMGKVDVKENHPIDKIVDKLTLKYNTTQFKTGALDVKTGLLTGLLTGIQGWKCPVALSQTCYGSKSLKVILMDSNFGGHPVLNPLVTL